MFFYNVKLAHIEFLIYIFYQLYISQYINVRYFYFFSIFVCKRVFMGMIRR